MKVTVWNSAYILCSTLVWNVFLAAGVPVQLQIFQVLYLEGLGNLQSVCNAEAFGLFVGTFACEYHLFHLISI